MSRSFKKHPYTGSKAFDMSCRCHGGCPHCEANRLLYTRIGDDLLKQGLQEIDNSFFKPILRLPPPTGGSPRRVDIDLTKARAKIKAKLSGIGGIGSTHRC